MGTIEEEDGEEELEEPKAEEPGEAEEDGEEPEEADEEEVLALQRDVLWALYIGFDLCRFCFCDRQADFSPS